MSAAIDLGELRRWPATADVAPQSGARTRRHRRSRAAAVVIAMACVAGLTAGAPPAPRPVAVSSFGGDFQVAGGTVVRITLDGGSLVGERLAGGQAWRIRAEPGSNFTGLMGVDPILVGQRDACASSVSAVDLSTGSIRWTRPGLPASAPAAGHFLLAPAAGDCHYRPGTPVDLDVVDLDTGTVAATLDNEHDDGLGWAPDGRSMLVHRGDGTLVRIDLTTGARTTRRLANVAVGWARPLYSLAGTENFWLGGVTSATGVPTSSVTIIKLPGQWVVTGPAIRAVTRPAIHPPRFPSAFVMGVDESTLRPLWRTTIDVDPLAGAVQPHLRRCGDLLCWTAGGDADLTVGLDPRTGAVRWRTAGLLRTSGAPWALAEAPIAGGEPLASPEAPRALQVLDTRTGHVVRDLGEWRLHDNRASGGRILLTRARPAGWTEVAGFDPQTGRVSTLARLPDLVDTCRASGTRLLCRNSAKQVHIWLLP